MTTAKQLEILQHSLGVDQYGQGRQYRNHFVTGEGCSDHTDCMANVQAGVMTHRTGNALSGGSDIFHVTQVGINYVEQNSPKPPKISKSKQRYQRFREYGDGCENFIAYCRWDASPDRSWNGGPL